MSDLEKMLTDTVKDFKASEKRGFKAIEKEKKVAVEIAELAKTRIKPAEK